jgi:O-antigen/teichoic acid export membrane protein
MIRCEADVTTTRVLRNAIWLGAGEAAVKGGLLTVAVVIARGSGPSAVGTFSIAYGAALIGIMVLALGQQEVLIREVARAPGQARSLLAASHRIQRRLAVWLLPAAALAAFAASETTLRLSVLAFIPYVLLRTEMVTRGAAFKGRDRMDVEVRARGLEISVAALCVGVTTFLGWPIWTAGVAFSFGAAVGLAWIDARTKELDSGLSTTSPPAPLRQGLSFMAIAVFGQLLVNTDRFLLEFFGVARIEIGHWGAAGTLVWALVAVPQLFSVALYPTFSRAAQRGDSWRRAGLGSIAGGFGIGIACAVILRWAAGPLIHFLFGSEFTPAVALLCRLSMVLPGAFALMAVGAVYAAWRRQLLVMWVLAAAFCASVLLNLAWIPDAGAMASANAAVAAYSAAAAAMAVILVVSGGSKKRPM